MLHNCMSQGALHALDRSHLRALTPYPKVDVVEELLSAIALLVCMENQVGIA